MTIKKLCQYLTLGLAAQIAIALPLPGETILIQTHFSSILGYPSWLLIVRDVQTGQILPYVYDIQKEDNYWIALTAGRSYRITVSQLKFGPYAKILNFCHLENGIISGYSYMVSLTGNLTPNTQDFKCRVNKYKNISLNDVVIIRK